VNTRLRTCAALVLLVITGGVALIGCSADQVEHAAQDVTYMAGGAAPAGATQPTAGQSAVRTTVQVASAVSPAVGQIAAAIGGISAIVAGVAGFFRGKKAGQALLHPVITEIADDVAFYKDPATPWTEKTRDLLIKLGRIDAAFSEQPKS
jgi:hypothetical protein